MTFETILTDTSARGAATILTVDIHRFPTSTIPFAHGGGAGRSAFRETRKSVWRRA